MKQTHPIYQLWLPIYSYIVVKSKNSPVSCLLKRLPYKSLPFIVIVIIIVITMKLYNIVIVIIIVITMKLYNAYLVALRLR